MIDESELLAGFPAEVPVDPAEVAASVSASGRVLVVLDDDPTGTQSVADLPVLTRWEPEDFRWALTHRIDGRAAPAIYVLTNTRSLDPAETAERNRQVVRSALAAAGETGTELGFVSRSDSTLRGHFPLEPDVLADTVREVTGERTDGVVIVPAFPDAGRVTIGGVHYMREAGGLVPVAETEFARDATFGFRSSALAEYVEEKSAGRFPAGSVIVLDLAIIRGGAAGIADAVSSAADSTPVVADAVTENDLRALALGLAEAERRGKRLLYRVGPPFVRARIGQEERAPLTAADAYAGTDPAPGGGLIVVGSHVGLTTRQLGVLVAEHRGARVVELDVERLLDADADAGSGSAHVATTVQTVVDALADGDVVLHTSRLLVKTEDPAESLRIARTVSAAVVDVVRRTLAARPPRFVIAKGGITSSDVAAHGLEIRHGVVRGPMLPGIVSLWQPVDGPARGIPYIVFAGNVGDDRSLLDVVRTLSTTTPS
ncbi:four-carbon acid sugar kinase family protein [Planctomonas deserti]|uniref:four-carbon acid sugar kinase family protein n=1 Tax=Planctomonas deserti TaxID=2144185 RepID=UPI000D3CC27C|nr:four-carbon acid sugar kinase family protein [Planctomonas deserti]